MPAQRFDSIDTLRGVAIVWMTVFHFCFDLNHAGWIRQDFYGDAFWTTQRAIIVSLFLFCAGLGQAAAVDQGQDWRRFWKRWAQVAACALLVTAGSMWMFPKSYIYFGVLHGIALMLVVVRLTAGWGRWLWLAGAAVILLKPLAVQAHALWFPALDFLNSKPWNWLGLVSRKPVTEDYVPLVPWLGVMWWGVASGQWLLHEKRALLARCVPMAAPLSWLGRWSLTWYMLHQPVLIGLLMLFTRSSP
jgi:uncharacterized membrane protein